MLYLLQQMLKTKAIYNMKINSRTNNAYSAETRSDTETMKLTTKVSEIKVLETYSKDNIRSVKNDYFREICNVKFFGNGRKRENKNIMKTLIACKRT